ncbi:hypothetical protein [Lysobacter antibioticus]|uniref:Uncharacterized protein n=1 Tax=Lysobacter antibioticus TaxID=84531 RepID=A0A0S2FDB3_LYSAN|nr:hypothetical protein [Lysobacter antibioticus]ALN81492.1 hypothetical protein LA76x_3366 [Lysobacter antibioticus]
MGNNSNGNPHEGGQQEGRDMRSSQGRPPHGQGHQPLPGENPPQEGEHKKRKVQNADLPPGEGHQPLPGEDAQDTAPKR